MKILRKLPRRGLQLRGQKPCHLAAEGDVGKLLAKEWKQAALKGERTPAPGRGLARGSGLRAGRTPRTSSKDLRPQEYLAKAALGLITSVQILKASSGGGAFKSRTSGHAGWERGGNQPRGLGARDR